jgi:uncharacterized YigZ family protein
VKRSKFIAGLLPVKSKDEAEQAYLEIKKKYYDATHNCFAYRIDANIFRYSDDGEPNGTAGKPILQMMDGKEILEVLCVVTRYFGGTKLGTGGLIRAYSDAAKEALNRTKILKKIRSKKIKLMLDYDLENNVRNLLNSYQGKLDNSEYSDHIEMNLLIPESKAVRFRDECIELSNNKIKIEIL